MGDTPTRPLLALADAAALLTQTGSLFEMETAVIGRRVCRVWKNGPQTLQDVFARTDAFADREAFICGTVRIRYGAFRKAVFRLAQEMAACGVGPGAKVALIMRNRPEWPLAFFATILTGAVIVPLNAWWSAPEMARALASCGAAFAVTDDEHFALLPKTQDMPKHVWVCGANTPGGVRRLEDSIGLMQSWGDLPEDVGTWPVANPDDPAAIFYTSGTEGHPRGVQCSHRNLLVSTLGMQYALALETLRSKGTPLADDFLETPQQSVLLSVPLFHVIGACAVLLPSLYTGARLVLMHKWDTEEGFRLISQERVSQLWGVPAVARMLLDHPARGHYDLSSLRLITYGGALYRPDLVMLLREAFPHADVACGWGMTETAAICTGISGWDFVRHPASCGLALPVCDIRVTDLAGGRDLPCDSVGELWVRGPNIAKGYKEETPPSSEMPDGGWLRTGDLASIDKEGFCTIVGRVKEMVIRGGENIYCSEVETVLCRHPAVREAALVPIEHSVLGEEPGAVVSLRPGKCVGEADLRAFAACDLAAYKVPVRIIFSTNPLPRNVSGKLARWSLRALFATPHGGG